MFTSTGHYAYEHDDAETAFCIRHKVTRGSSRIVRVPWCLTSRLAYRVQVLLAS